MRVRACRAVGPWRSLLQALELDGPAVAGSGEAVYEAAPSRAVGNAKSGIAQETEPIGQEPASIGEDVVPSVDHLFNPVESGGELPGHRATLGEQGDCIGRFRLPTGQRKPSDDEVCDAFRGHPCLTGSPQSGVRIHVAGVEVRRWEHLLQRTT